MRYFTILLLLFATLILPGSLLSKDSKPLDEDSPEGDEVICKITDTQGKTTHVKRLKLFIDQGKSKYFYRDFAMLVGDATLRIEFDTIAALVNRKGSQVVDIYLKNGKKITGNIFVRGDREYITGKAIYGNMTTDYKIDLLKVVSIVQEKPAIPQIIENMKQSSE